MAADINLLPEDLRSRESSERKKSTPEPAKGIQYSHPSGQASAPATEPELPSRLSRLVAALKATMGTAEKSGVIHETKAQSPKVKPQAPAAPGTFVLHNSGMQGAPAVPAKPLTPETRAPLTDTPARKLAEEPTVLRSGTQLETPAPQIFHQLPIPSKPQPKIDLNLANVPESSRAQGSAKLAPSPLIDVNLIPLSQQSLLTGRLWVVTVAVAVVCLLLVLVGYMMLSARQTQRGQVVTQAQSELEDLQGKLEESRAQTDNVEAVKERLKAVAQVLGDRQNWLPLFTALEETTVPRVYFTSIAADAGGVLSLVGSGPNYTEVARQLKAFQDSPQVSEVELSGLKNDRAAAGESVVSFTMKVRFKPQVFSLTSALP